MLAATLMTATAMAVYGNDILPHSNPELFSHFVGIYDFSGFAHSTSPQGETVLVSPEIPALADWNEAIVSWNATAPSGSYLKMEAQAISETRHTRFYTLAWWSPDNQAFPRASVSGQKDADGDVLVDILALNHPAKKIQIRLTLGGKPGALPLLKFIGVSFCNTKITPELLPPNRAAWRKTIATPEYSQKLYPGGNGWCSPTSLSMALMRWATLKDRTDWKFTVPAVAAGVLDHNFEKATGNWPFNTAFAGQLTGMRACVTRFSDISELEDWIAAGIPVIISARYDLLQDGRPDDFNGHLTLCCGFTETGDLVINDPWTDIRVERVQHIYKRANVRRAWATSRNTVYLVYPENVSLPSDRFGHW